MLKDREKKRERVDAGSALGVAESGSAPRVGEEEDGAEGLWRVRDVARVLALSPKAVYAMTARGEIPVVRIGGRLRYRPHTIRTWLASLER
jgi:excisionase family DNA binding protein